MVNNGYVHITSLGNILLYGESDVIPLTEALISTTSKKLQFTALPPSITFVNTKNQALNWYFVLPNAFRISPPIVLVNNLQFGMIETPITLKSFGNQQSYWLYTTPQATFAEEFTVTFINYGNSNVFGSNSNHFFGSPSLSFGN